MNELHFNDSKYSIISLIHIVRSIFRFSVFNGSFVGKHSLLAVFRNVHI